MKSIPGVHHPGTFIEIERLVQPWRTAELCDFPIGNGTILHAEISGADVDLIHWTVTREHEGVFHQVAGQRAATIDEAKAAVAKAVDIWKSAIEFGGRNGS